MQNSAKLSLPSDREVLIERDFHAPKALLFEAWSNPEFLAQWYGCATMPMVSCDIDFRRGGQWRWVLREAAGAEHAFSGEYREIARPDRLVYVERYEPIPGSDHLVAVALAEQGGVTSLQMRLTYDSQAQRDGHLKAGLESGLQPTFDRLEQVAQQAARLAS